MSSEKKGVEKAIRDFQIERIKIDKAIKETENVDLFAYHSLTGYEHDYLSTKRFLSNFEEVVEEMIKKIKLVRKTQKYPTIALVRAVEKIDQSIKESDQHYPITFVLRNDIRIQENIELRTESLDRLFKRFLTYIKVEKKKVNSSSNAEQFKNLKIDFFKRITAIVNFIRSELTSEKEIVEAEIKKLSDEIEKLE